MVQSLLCRKDVTRWQQFMRERWDVLRIHDDGLFLRPAETAVEIAEALERGSLLRKLIAH